MKGENLRICPPKTAAKLEAGFSQFPPKTARKLEASLNRVEFEINFQASPVAFAISAWAV